VATGDPYKVLGVSPTATDDEVKQAYRTLVKKYHPDKYAGSPLQDVASEKMKEVNAAYDEITSMRKNGGSSAGASGSYYGEYGGYASGGYGSSGSYASGNSQFADIRRLIMQNRLSEAEELLDGVALPQRDAEWYFLKGSVYYKKGWLDEALGHFAQASRMNPNNPEYRSAYQQCMYAKNHIIPGAHPPYRGGAAPPPPPR
jgi:curved DNA-binding protein CbpA